MKNHDLVYVFLSDVKSIIDEKTLTLLWKDLKDIAVDVPTMAENGKIARQKVLTKLSSNESIYLENKINFTNYRTDRFKDKTRLNVEFHKFLLRDKMLENTMWVRLGEEDDFNCTEHTDEDMCHGRFSMGCVICERNKTILYPFTQAKLHWANEDGI